MSGIKSPREECEVALYHVSDAINNRRLLALHRCMRRFLFERKFSTKLITCLFSDTVKMVIVDAT